MELLRLTNVHKEYYLGEIVVPVLHGVSLSVERGRMVAIMGASGSGKTTLMNIIGCLDRPTAGHYLLDGEAVEEMSADQRAMIRSRKIGFVFQNFNLLARTSALENVCMPLAYGPQRGSDAEHRKRAVELLQRVGLADRMDHEPSQLSGGQQQRVAIARALVNEPALVLADEPTGALDSHTSEEILDLFKQLNREQGVTIVLVTHEPDVASHAELVIRISDGLIEQVGPPSVVLSSIGALHAHSAANPQDQGSLT